MFDSLGFISKVDLLLSGGGFIIDDDKVAIRLNPDIVNGAGDDHIIGVKSPVAQFMPKIRSIHGKLGNRRLDPFILIALSRIERKILKKITKEYLTRCSKRPPATPRNKKVLSSRRKSW